MPLSSTENRKIYTGNGVTKVFPFANYFLANADLVVIKTEIASGAATLLALNTDYTVTGAGNESGGSVALKVAPTSAYKVTIYRDPALTQEVDFQNNGALPAKQLEQPVDKLTMIAQRIDERLSRAARLADGDISGADMTLPTPEAGKYIRWNTGGDGLENTSLIVPSGTVSTATPAAEGLIEIATTAEINALTDNQRAITPLGLASSDLSTRVAVSEVDVDSLQQFNTSDNIVINGGFTVDQRGFATLGATASDDTYCIDRWNLLAQLGPVGIENPTDPEDGTEYCLRLKQQNAVAQRMGVEQIVLASSCRFLRGRDVVLGARVRCISAQTIRYAILEWTGTKDTVTSDVVNDWTSASYTTGNFFLASNLLVTAVGSKALAANTWTDLPALTGTISSSMNNIIVFFWTESAVDINTTIDLARVQLVAGTVLPAFKNEDHNITLMRCFRFYQTSFGNHAAPIQNAGFTPAGQGMFAQVVGASTVMIAPITFRFTMWKTPNSITLYNPNASNAQARNATRSADNSLTTASTGAGYGFYITTTSAAGSAAGDRVSVHWSASAEL